MGIGQIEKSILSMANESDLSSILKAGVDESYFVEHSKVFNFIVSHYQKYNNIPSPEILKDKYNFDVVEQLDSEIAYYIDQLSECKVERELAEVIDKSLDLIEDNALDSLDYLVDKIIKLKGEVEDKSHLSYTDGEATNRVEKLADKMLKANQEKLLGIPTGIDVFDRVTGGWQPGHLSAIVGRLGEGKSWLLMHFCVEAYKAGEKILYLSPEMPSLETELRFDTMMSKRFRNTDLVLGKPNIDVGEYEEYLEWLEERSDWITYDSVPGGKAFTIPTIQALVGLHKPTVLAVDGVPLVADDSVKESWQKMMTIGYGLKGIAINYGIVVLCTSQSTRQSAMGKNIPKLHEISYGDALAQACDKVIGIAKISTSKIKMGMPKNRGGKIVGEFFLDYKVDTGIIAEVKEELPEDDDEEKAFSGGFQYEV